MPMMCDLYVGSVEHAARRYLPKYGGGVMVYPPFSDKLGMVNYRTANLIEEGPYLAWKR